MKNDSTVYLAHDKSGDHTNHVKSAEATAKCRPPCRGGDLGHVDSSRRRSEAKSQAQEDTTKVEEVDVRGQGGAEEPGEEEGTDQATGHPSSKILSENSSQKTGGDCGKGKQTDKPRDFLWCHTKTNIFTFQLKTKHERQHLRDE